MIYGKQKSKNQMVGYGRIGFPNEEEKEATREIEGLLAECLILDSFRYPTEFITDTQIIIQGYPSHKIFCGQKMVFER